MEEPIEAVVDAEEKVEPESAKVDEKEAEHVEEAAGSCWRICKS